MLFRNVFLIIDVNFGEIIPMITFIFAARVCISYIRSSNSTLDTSETSSIDYANPIYK